MAEINQRRWRDAQGRRHSAWGFSFQAGGKQHKHYSEAWSRREAEEALAARRLAIEMPTSAKTFAEVIEEYVAYKRGKGKRSLFEDIKLLRKLQARLGGDTPIAEITAQRIAAYERERIAEPTRMGRPIKPATVNRDLSCLRHLLRLCEEWGYIEKVPRIRLGPEPEGRLRFLLEEEIVRLLEACARKSRKSPVLLPMVKVALNTGMRAGELKGLRWDRVDFSRGVIRLEQTKSGKRREIPMNETVYAVLSELATGGGPTGYVFQKRDGQRWGSIRRAFESAVQEAKIEDFVFHDLRHTFASHFMMSTGDLPSLQKILGHATLAMTMRYAHLSQPHLRSAISALRFSAQSAHGEKVEAVAPRNSVN